MKHLRFLLTVLLLVAAMPAHATTDDLVPPGPEAGEEAWAAFSANLVVALKSDNEGLRVSALHRVAEYGEKLDVCDARFEMVSLFRDSKDERVRMLALAALSKAKDAWIADFFYRSARLESDPHMASLMYHVALANDQG